MLMTIITSIAAESNQLLTGALLSGIVVYIFLRIRSYYIARNSEISKCATTPFSQIKNIINQYLKIN